MKCQCCKTSSLQANGKDAGLLKICHILNASANDMICGGPMCRFQDGTDSTSLASNP